MILLNEIEKCVLETATVRPGSVFSKLYAQIGNLKISSRDLTGAGFLTEMESVGAEQKANIEDFEITDIEGSAESLKNGFGCVVFIKRGQIDTIECFAYDEPWPQELGKFELRIVPETRVNLT